MYGKKYRRKNKKTSKPRRKARRSYKTLSTVRTLAPFAQRYITKMKYSQSVSLSTSGAQQFYKFNLNSVFDPDYTGVGHQPYGYDTLSTIYNRYRVVSCSYVIAVSAGTSSFVQVVAVPANENYSSLDIDDLKEKPRAKYIYQAPQANIAKLKGRVSIPSLMGRTKSQYMADDRFQAVVSGNPSEQAVLNILVKDMNASSNLTCAMDVVLTYVVEFFDPTLLSQS